MLTDHPVEDGIFTVTADGPCLIGSRCTACGTHTFPVQDGCPRCTGTSMERVELARRGTLWTWTIQGFPPKSPPYVGDIDPERFEPFGVGYIDLPDQLKVEARLTERDPSRLHIGMEMELVLVPLASERDGRQIVTFGFAPTGTGHEVPA
jgi:uncharacterized protein